MEARLLLDLQATLGEGLMWSPSLQRLYFTDIKAPALFELDLGTLAYQRWSMPTLTGWLIERQQGGFIAGLQTGFAEVTLSPSFSVRPFLNPHPASPDMRLNDAKANQLGQIYAGSMHNLQPENAMGKLYRLDPDRTLYTLDTDYHICNGPTLSVDQRTLYHTDTLKQTIYRYQIDSDGNLSNRQVWKVFTEAEGYPDGMTIDSENCLWVAHWGGGCVSRFAPTGDLLARVQLPASQITNVTFAGPNLDRLVVTSAREGLSAAALTKEPLAGGLFEIINSGCKGLPAGKFGG